MTDPSLVAATDQGSAVFRDVLDAHGVTVADPEQLHAVNVTLDLAIRTYRKQGALGLWILNEWARGLNP